MNKFLYFCILVLMFCGCSTTANGNNLFVSERDYDIGRSVDVVPLTPSKTSSHNLYQDKYLFEWDSGCKFVYYVNKKTKIVESWNYISSPAKCSMGFDLFSPW